MKQLKIIMLFTMLLIADGAFAQDTGYRPGFSVDYLHSQITVEANGVSTAIHQSSRTVLTEQGIKQIGQFYIAYSESRQSIDVLDAYTLRPDGQKVQVRPSAIMTKESPVSVSAPLFSDYKMKAIVFPEVTVGAKLFVKYKSDQKTPHFPGHFFFVDTFSPHVAFGSYQIDLSAPKELTLYSEAVRIQEERLPDADGTAHWRWTGANEKAVAPEPGSVDAFDYAPRLVVSSLKDYASLAKVYQDHAHDKAKVTPKIQALADHITQGISDRQERIRALYHWVSKNIRYVAIFLNAGAVVPHEAETILENKYGDCKDHVVLLEALLAAMGIHSSPALINLGRTYSLPKVAALHVFNHVITYLSEDNIYLDSTAQYAPFGTLPDADMDKAVLLTATGKLGQTPERKSSDNGNFSKVVIKINADGSATGSSAITSTGIYEVTRRAGVASGMAQPSERVVADTLARNKEHGSGTINRGEPGNLDTSYVLTSTFKIDNLINVPGPGAMTIPLGISSTNIEEIGNSVRLKNRSFPFVCGSSTFDEQRTLEFPDEIKIISVPKNVQFSNQSAQYTATYELIGQKLVVKRRLESTRHSRVCEPTSTDTREETVTVIQKDVRAQILYQ